MDKIEDLLANREAWKPSHDDRIEPLLLAEAARRDAACWNYEDAETVIAFLLSRLDATYTRPQT